LEASLSLTVSEIFNGECDAMAGMTLNDLLTKIKVIHFGTAVDFSYASSYRLSILNSNVCSRTHRLDTIHTLQTTDGRNTVA